MRRLWAALWLLAWPFTACGSESTTTMNTEISSETSSGPRDVSPSTIPVAADSPATSAPASGSATTQPRGADSTSIATESLPGVPLDAVIEPYEAKAVEESDGFWASYTLECWTPPVARGGDWPPPVDREQLVSRGSVVECVPRTDPPADTSGVWIIVLDNVGTATSWYEATDGTGAPPIVFDRQSGLLCREYMALPAFAESMANLAEPPWRDDTIAYQFVLAYWFLEGEPSRMDVDGNHVPCEQLFDPAVVAEVWTGDF
jgi:hypothetical protein